MDDLAPAQPPAVPSSRRQLQRWRVVGYALLAVWAGFWFVSFKQNVFALDQRSWVPNWTTLGLDFMHNFRAVHGVIEGLNPYSQQFGDFRGFYSYPPVVLVEFAWCALIPRSGQYAANILWALCIAGMVIWATRVAARQRAGLTIGPVALPLVAALVLLSTPVLFEMERGNCNALVLFFIIVASLLMQSDKTWRETLAGLAIALAIWTKVYPAAMLFGLLVTRRYRVLAWTLAACVVIPLILFKGTHDFLQTFESFQAQRLESLHNEVSKTLPPQLREPPVIVHGHSLTSYWPRFWLRLGVMRLARFNSLIGTGLLISPLPLWIGYRIRRLRDARPIIFPLLVWLTLLSTFWMPMSYDYNLVFYPVLVVAVYSLRDGIGVGLALVAATLYYQPLGVHIRKTWGMEIDELMLLLKVLALLAVTVSLAHRARDLEQLENSPRLDLPPPSYPSPVQVVVV